VVDEINLSPLKRVVHKKTNNI